MNQKGEEQMKWLILILALAGCGGMEVKPVPFEGVCSCHVQPVNLPAAGFDGYELAVTEDDSELNPPSDIALKACNSIVPSNLTCTVCTCHPF